MSWTDGDRISSKYSGPYTSEHRQLKIPIRDYLCSTLPGLANFPINRIAELTPAAWLARKLTAEIWRKFGEDINHALLKTDTFDLPRNFGTDPFHVW
jgi:hypothetical protein